jgi:sigma-E factor negative regulatory protein RseC
MIEAPGVVERVGADAVWVRLTAQQTGCGRCDEPGGCGGARIAHAFGKPNEVFRIDQAQGFEVGQSVRLVADERAALYAGLASYGLPTLGAIAGVALGTAVAASSGAIVGLVAGLGLSVLGVRRLTAAAGWSQRLRVSIQTAACRQDRGA